MWKIQRQNRLCFSLPIKILKAFKFQQNVFYLFYLYHKQISRLLIESILYQSWFFREKTDPNLFSNFIGKLSDFIIYSPDLLELKIPLPLLNSSAEVSVEVTHSSCKKIYMLKRNHSKTLTLTEIINYPQIFILAFHKKRVIH